jgi:hypothetical protein
MYHSFRSPNLTLIRCSSSFRGAVFEVSVYCWSCALQSSLVPFQVLVATNNSLIFRSIACQIKSVKVLPLLSSLVSLQRLYHTSPLVRISRLSVSVMMAFLFVEIMQGEQPVPQHLKSLVLGPDLECFESLLSLLHETWSPISSLLDNPRFVFDAFFFFFFCILLLLLFLFFCFLLFLFYYLNYYHYYYCYY